MFSTVKIKASKIISCFMAVLMLLTSISVRGDFTVFAAGLDNYTVRLVDDENNVIDIDDAEVTLINKADSTKTMTKNTVDGSAAFDNFIETGETYSVSVASITGYEDVASYDVTVTENMTSIDVVLTAIGTITISGTVINEEGNGCAGVTVNCEGYTNQQTVTDWSGNYSFEVYKVGSYTVTAVSNETKYNNVSTTVFNPTENYTCTPLQFQIKQYNIISTVGSEGALVIRDLDTNVQTEIRDNSENTSVDYGSNKTITVTADEGYRIDAIEIDGVAVTGVTGEKSYSTDFSNITQGHEISVTFKRMTYKIEFTVRGNGEVKYLDGTEQTVAGGQVDIDFNESTDAANPTVVEVTAVPSTDYRVSKVSVDGIEQTFTENNKYYSVSFEMKNNHTFEVEFALNTYTVTAISGDHGTVVLDKEIVDCGGTANVTITPNDNSYRVSSIVVKTASDAVGVVIDRQTDTNYSEEENGIAQYSITNINENTIIEVNYEEIPAVSVEWSELVSISATQGSLVNSYVDNDGNDVLVYTKGAEISLSAKTPYNRVKYSTGNTYKNWSSSERINRSCAIDRLQVKTGRWGNETEIDLSGKKIIIIIDNTKPVVTPDETEIGWSNQESVTITGKVTDADTTTDPSSGLAYVVWSKDAVMSEEDILAETVNKAAIGADGKYTFDSEDGEQESTYYIYAVDNAGNISEAKTVLVKIDRNLPVITGFTYSTSESYITDEGISYLEFGTIYKGDVYVTVTASDEDISSGLKEITLYCGTEILETKSVSGNMATFKLTKSEFEGGKEITAVAKDNALNDSIPTKPVDEDVISKAKSNIVKIDDTKPEAVPTPDEKVYTDSDDNSWYSSDVEFNITAKAENTGIKSIVIKLNGQEIASDLNDKAINSDFSTSYITEESFVVSTSQNPVDGKNTIEVIVTNNAGVVCDETKLDVYIDSTAPGISDFNITRADRSMIEEILNFLTFGIFFNEKIEVTVTASDSNASAGINNITLFADGEEVGTKEVNSENKCTFTLPINDIISDTVLFDGQLSAKATDNVGHTTDSAVYPTTENSNVQNSGLMIETIKPQVTVNLEEAVTDKNSVTMDTNDWYSEDVEFAITARDEDSGLRSVQILINDTVVDTDKNGKNISEAFNERTYKTTIEEFIVSTDQVSISEDGSYTLKVIVTDNSGNISDEYIKTIYKDIDKPYITGFDFEPADYVEASETSSTVEVTDYGFYFKDDTKVTISSKDETPSSGIKSIIYYIVDKDTGMSEETVALVDADGKVEFTVRADFKGQIYAKATDNVNNAVDNFVNPNSAIIESEEKHKEENHIEFTKEETVLKANDNTELYSKDIPVTITITDTYSGIREIEWSVIAPYDIQNNQMGKVTLNNDKSVVEGSDTDWQQTAFDANLVTEMMKTITVNNNSNNIIIKVKMTDRAGNISEDQIELSIDKTAPVISITYDNNTPDSSYTDVYKENRVATITVKERNFKAEDIVYSITNTDGVIPMLSKWTGYENVQVPDETYHTATIVYASDGDYTFNISYEDLAKNAANSVDQSAFTIDKTIPTVSVAYNNNSVINGNYYSAERTATITIVEHNFDSARVNIIGAASDNGVMAAFPAISGWSHNGDTHVATINYSADLKYSFDIEFNDNAGNTIADFVPQEFYVDKTPPTLEISGVTDKSANNGIIAPVITYSDTNLNRDSVTILLTGINNGEVNYSGTYENIANGQRFTYANFEEIQKVDDIYTLTVTLTDMAGNETAQTISFSANRFGSVYDLTLLKELNGKFFKTEKDVVFTETNVDALSRDTIKIKLIKNGVPIDLVEDTDYTIDVTGGDGQWSQYKYTIKKELFADDGRYSISVYSVDAAGNSNENIDESKTAEISFGVDKTAPVIVPIDIEDGKQYPVEVKTASIEIKDNLVLEDVKIYLNGKEVEYKVDGENYTFDIPESNEKQNVRIVVVDAAGNEREFVIEDLLVSTNVFVRWYNNTALFAGSIAGAVIVVLGGITLILFGKKRKKEEEEEE